MWFYIAIWEFEYQNAIMIKRLIAILRAMMTRAGIRAPIL